MAARSKWRGHNIIFNDEGKSIFESTGKLTSEDIWCKCGHCGKEPTKEDHDGCIGELIGLANACCGHGNENEAYVQFLDGTGIQGKDAVVIQEILKRTVTPMTKEERYKFLKGTIKFHKEEWRII